jgi:hypothetical protein
MVGSLSTVLSGYGHSRVSRYAAVWVTTVEAGSLSFLQAGSQALRGFSGRNVDHFPHDKASIESPRCGMYIASLGANWRPIVATHVVPSRGGDGQTHKGRSGRGNEAFFQKGFFVGLWVEIP